MTKEAKITGDDGGLSGTHMLHDSTPSLVQQEDDARGVVRRGARSGPSLGLGEYDAANRCVPCRVPAWRMRWICFWGSLVVEVDEDRERIATLLLPCSLIIILS